MARRTLVLALLLAGASAVAAENSPAPVAPTVKEALPKPTTASPRKPAERKAGEAPKNSRGTPTPPPPRLEEKNLGLGCAQG